MTKLNQTSKVDRRMRCRGRNGVRWDASANAETVKIETAFHFGSPKQPETKWIFHAAGRRTSSTIRAAHGRFPDLFRHGAGRQAAGFDLAGREWRRRHVLHATRLSCRPVSDPDRSRASVYRATSGEAFSQVAWDWLEKYAHTEFTNKLKGHHAERHRRRRFAYHEACGAQTGGPQGPQDSGGRPLHRYGGESRWAVYRFRCRCRRCTNLWRAARPRA